jgi:hypothetical protein
MAELTKIAVQTFANLGALVQKTTPIRSVVSIKRKNESFFTCFILHNCYIVLTWYGKITSEICRKVLIQRQEGFTQLTYFYIKVKI